MTKSRLLICIPLIALAMAASAYVGYREGERSAKTHHEPAKPAGGAQKEASGSPVGSPEESRASGPSPEQLASEKGVPAAISKSDGDYTLISVIEGAAINQRLTENLQLVVLQRQQLVSLAKQFDEAPGSAVQQRELIAGQINEVRNALNGNLQFMAQNYGYTFDRSYVRVPHKVSLVGVGQSDGKATSEVVHEFQTAEAFAEFQKKNDDYLRAKMEIAKTTDPKAEGDSKEKTEAAAQPANDPKADPKAEAEVAAKRDELIKSYRFDPELQYNLQYQKTAFYARAAR